MFDRVICIYCYTDTVLYIPTCLTPAAPCRPSMTTTMRAAVFTAGGAHTRPWRLDAALALLVAVVGSVIETPAAGDVYVSPAGSDATGDGSPAAPFASLPRAQQAVRQVTLGS